MATKKLTFETLSESLAKPNPEDANQTLAYLLQQPQINNNPTQEPSANDGSFFLPIDKLIPHPDNPFNLYKGKKLDDLIKSVTDNGIIEPIVVRPFEDGYQILAGHNRTNVARMVGLTELPCIVRDVNDDLAKIIVVESNFLQRGMDDLLPSEIAKALKMQLDAIKHQGKKLDDINYAFFAEKSHNNAKNSTCVQIEHKLKSADKVASDSGNSKSQVQRYIRLNYLSPQLLQLVDDKKLGFIPAVDVSYLNSDEQELLYEYIEAGKKLTVERAKTLKELSQNDKLTVKSFERTMTATEQKKSTTRAPRITKASKQIKSLFPSHFKDKEIEEIIIKAVTEYLKSHDLKTEYEEETELDSNIEL